MDLNKPETLFLIDGIGALVSAILLGVVLVAFNEFIGMPIHVLRVLAIVALFLSVYSISRLFLIKNNWRPWLKAIAVMNVLYCCLTIVLVVVHFDQLTVWGVVYFVVEVFIIMLLAGREWKVGEKP